MYSNIAAFLVGMAAAGQAAVHGGLSRPATVRTRQSRPPMKIKSPIVTLLVGVLVAVVILILSVRANDSTGRPYGAAIPALVLR
jgi:hypothetical protein